MAIKQSKGSLTVEDIQNKLLNSTVKEMPIKKELETSFMAYAMSVIVSRALPDVRDGFKPVHRRVLYAAHGLGMTADRPYKKSARLVGEVIGKYHPHGDTAVYYTMVRMAQDFSLRYCLVDGHGNFGSIDGDNPAAMRYTEARLSKIAGEMLDGLNQGTVDFVPNYDASEKEPVVLPAAFPNLLVNGSSGIAVGMATNMPTHNLNEVCDGIKAVLKGEAHTNEDLLNIIHGPDFPTGGEILGIGGIRDYFETGRGSVIVRAKTHFEELQNGHLAIVIDEIPYMVNKKNLTDKIVEVVQNGTVDEIIDFRDETNREGIRVVLPLKQGSIPEVVLNKLFKVSQLQTTFSVNNLALKNNAPKVLSMMEMIESYIEHQTNVLIRKAKFDLAKAESRFHIVSGFMIVIKGIDEAVQIIKQSSNADEAIEKLMQRFGLTVEQSKAVLEMRLRALTSMEYDRLETEANDLQVIIAENNEIIHSSEKRIQLMIASVDRLVEKYGDERRTTILKHATGNLELEDLIPEEDILITISRNGWVKRVPIDTYRTQNRGGVGIIGAKTHDDDDVEKIVVANTHADVLFFTNTGRVFRTRGHELPVGSRTSKGKPANNFLPIDKKEKVLSILPIGSEYEGYLIFVTKNGLIKKTDAKEFAKLNRNGKIAISLREGDDLFAVHFVPTDVEMFVGSSTGHVVRFNTTEIRPLSRIASGVKAINVGPKGIVVGSGTSNDGEYILSVGERGIGILTEADAYRLAKRGGKGVLTMKSTPKTGHLLTILAVNLNDELLMVSKTGNVIRLAIQNISIISRNASGVKLMNLDEKDKLVSLALFPQQVIQEVGEEVE